LIGLSMMFALWLEWVSLRALLHLMPGRAREGRAAMQPVAVEAVSRVAAGARSRE